MQTCCSAFKDASTAPSSGSSISAYSSLRRSSSALMGGTAAIISGDYEQIIVVSGGATGAVWTIVGVLAFWISLAVGVKRWHDRNKSGWWMLIILVPVIGSLWYLIECGFLKGTTGPNTYGPDPLAAA